jgi:type IV secretory pathway TraG/TraD family ATPase VirD4
VGEVKIFDPTGILAARAEAEGRPVEAVATAKWSPLRMCRTITGAQSAAKALTDVAARSGLADADFFMGAAKELLWSVLYAAAVGGFEMRHVVRWVTIQDRPHYNRQGLVVRPSEMEQILTVAAADPARETEATQALDGLRGVWELDERSRSSIFATARIVIEAWSDPVVAAASAGCDITPEWLLGGDNTLYIVAPARDQGRFRPVFACMVADLVNAAFDCANRSKGGELALPLLVLLDEAANICPVRELPTWCSTCASHGIQLVHVWQDRSQQRARYGREGAETIWNNSAAKIICSGLADAATGEVTQLLGEEETERRGWSADVGGPRRSVSTQTMHRRLVSADSMRRQQPGQALLIYKHLPPSALSLRLWYRDSGLKALKEGDGETTSPIPPQGSRWPRAVERA